MRCRGMGEGTAAKCRAEGRENEAAGRAGFGLTRFLDCIYISLLQNRTTGR